MGTTRNKLGSGQPLLPKNTEDIEFCDLFVRLGSHAKAAQEIGHDGKWGWARKKKYAQYLARRMIQREEALAREMVIGQKEILAELLALGMANPLDYIESYEVTVGGKLITKYRQRPLTSLTRHQAASVSSIKFLGDGSVSYRIPNRHEKIPGLIHAGRHFGMFHDKLIAEHRHQHLHQGGPDLSEAHSDTLERMEAELIKAIGPDQARKLLGVTIDGEYEDVSRS